MDMRTLKLQVKDTIIAAVKRDGSAKKDVLIASLGLETGLSKKKIEEIFADMKLADYLIINENDVVLGKKSKW